MDGAFLKQNNGRYGGIVGAWSNGGSLPVLLETLYPKHLSQKLSGICMLLLCGIAFTSIPSVTLCAFDIRLLVYHSIFRKSHILDLSRLKIVYIYCLIKE